MELDGSPAEGNPVPTSTVWSDGHRNPQGLAFTPNGDLYASEHGDRADDEINRIVAGSHYGWPRVEGYCDQENEQAACERNDVVEPLITFSPTAAPAGIAYYGHSAIPEWHGALLQVFLKGKMLTVFRPRDDGSLDHGPSYFLGDYLRLRDVAVAPDGRIFLATSNLEIVEPPRRDGDDKILEVTGYGPETDLALQLTESKTGLVVTVPERARGGRVQITHEYPKVLWEQAVPEAESGGLEFESEWRPPAAGSYSLKCDLPTGERLYRRFQWRGADSEVVSGEV